MLDINGVDNPPNIMGKNIFYFYISPYAIIPFGMSDDPEGRYFQNTCKRTLTNSLNVYGCTAFIHKENLDYLHCDDLSWDGKLKCD